MALVIEAFAEGVHFLGAIRADDPHRAAVAGRGAVVQLVRGDDARPRFGEGGFGVAGFCLLDGDEVVAVVAVEHALVDDGVFGKAAVDFVAVGAVFAVVEDVGLDDEAVADLVLVLQVLADGHDGDAHFVAQHDGCRSSYRGGCAGDPARRG